MSISSIASILILAAVAAPEDYVTGPVETVAEGFQFTEGPVWLTSGELVYSDIPADTIFRTDKSVFRKPSGKSNGLTLDQEGRLIACEHWNRRVSRTEMDGTIVTLADTYEGKKLNSPNDAVVRSDGTIYFTDPPYGLEGREQELPHQGLYSIAPDGTLTLLVDDFIKPNGIGLSPDGKTLYVADTEGLEIRAFDVAEDGSLSNGRVFCDLPYPDGMAIDTKGNVWCTAEDGVRVFTPAGELVHTVVAPQAPANCTFGGNDGKTLYITARTGLYKVSVVTPGILPGR
ncbi:MAG: SMP-30/gluconolactonase/LRE family protein [Candidatus Hydrogenedentes bacterium]|nr:SMP-30/gluconolactonase/LRE family protein [Candidatus Hydrogenedentota bacterium]